MIVLTSARPRDLRAVVACTLLALAVTACGGSASTTTTNAIGPSPVRCAATATTTSSTFSFNGGAGELKVQTERECQWTASTDAGWIALKPTSGQGPGTVQVSVARNDQGRSRAGAVVVNDQRLTVSQEAAPCRIQLDGPGAPLTADGAAGSVRVSTLAGCRWTATTDAAWIDLRGPTSGDGNGDVAFTAGRNDGTDRAAVIRVNGVEQAVTQRGAATRPPTTPTPAPAPPPDSPLPAPPPDAPAPPSPSPSPAPPPPPSPPPSPACTVDLDRTDASVGAGGGDVRVAVQTAARCSWSAASAAPWITIVSSASGTGPGDVRLSIASNGGGARTGVVTVSGATVTVSQAAAPAPAPPPPEARCVFDVTPPRASFGAEGGSARAAIRTTDGCGWTASSQAGWITIETGNSGKGSGEVRYRVDGNKQQSARSGVLILADTRLTIEQDAAAPAPPVCTIQVEGPEDAVDSDGGDVRLRVRAGPLCRWNVSSRVDWISLSSGPGGIGNDDVRLRVARNSGGARRGTVDVGDRSVSIDQKGAEEREERNVDIKGRIDDLRGSCPRVAFTVEHRAVQTTADTRYSDGSCSSLRNEMKVKVKGFAQGDAIIAVSIELDR